MCPTYSEQSFAKCCVNNSSAAMAMNNPLAPLLNHFTRTNMSPSAQTSSGATNPRRSSIFQLFGRKPKVRRALSELGTIQPNERDCPNNIKFAEELLTIDVEKFKRKWSFDPLAMKPVVAAQDSTYEWKLIKSKKDVEASKERKEMESNLFSLIPSNRKQLFLETVPVFEQETTPVVIKETNPVVTKETNPVVIKETTPVVTKETTPVHQEAKEVSATKEAVETVQRRLAHTIDPKEVVAAPTKLVPKLTVSVAARIDKTNQRKMTDFTQQRKRANSCVNGKEDKDSLHTPSSKRTKLSPV